LTQNQCFFSLHSVIFTVPSTCSMHCIHPDPDRLQLRTSTLTSTLITLIPRSYRCHRRTSDIHLSSHSRRPSSNPLAQIIGPHCTFPNSPTGSEPYPPTQPPASLLPSPFVPSSPPSCHLAICPLPWPPTAKT
jgi:hypothetical protein